MLCPEETLLYQMADPLSFVLSSLLWTCSYLSRCHLFWQSLESFHYICPIQSMGFHVRDLGYKTEASARSSEKTSCQKQPEKLNKTWESKAPLLKHNYAKREYEIIKAGLAKKRSHYLKLSTSSDSRCSKASTVISARMIDDAVVNNFCIRKSTEPGQIKKQ